MKKLLFILIASLSVINIYAQEESHSYRPFVEEGKVWYISNNLRYWMEGDTLINGHQCKKWMQQNPGTQGDDETVYTCYAYEENKKVWTIAESDTLPRLLFDYGAKVGDTLYVGSANARINYLDLQRGYSLLTDTIIITDIKYEYWGGRIQKAFLYRTFDYGYLLPPYFKDCIMEGIGCWRYPSLIGLQLYGRSWGILERCTVGDEILYQHGLNDGIKNVRTSSSPNRLFDLSGRRLSAPPARGVYIEDGKKKVVN